MALNINFYYMTVTIIAQIAYIYLLLSPGGIKRKCKTIIFITFPNILNSQYRSYISCFKYIPENTSVFVFSSVISGKSVQSCIISRVHCMIANVYEKIQVPAYHPCWGRLVQASPVYMSSVQWQGGRWHHGDTHTPGYTLDRTDHDHTLKPNAQ